ncbi:hypothetical protein KSC_092080 [Ktedonobacter sp. SOSP1-52]|uniref:xanthine dehydrogenase family protein molybdopterin-binding subunit n=1 Tax=Ktedonobacter sp. SOSP1-52 TaxID=2778366 RepID=UPI001915C422|nr:xanthine dehydrogenase family protein molybdopterin-binding subunit [Ktedonobacter sp. SOSP1-52]GHO70316.1 hypothetical protein KSC_092080 [Ktedonobacter sp. SOSP1-52]
MTQSAPQTSSPSVGQPVDRVDGLLKVTGQARYPAEFPFERMAHAVIVQSTIARGSIKTIETVAAEAAPGVLAVLTHLNAPRLHSSPPALWWGQRRRRLSKTNTSLIMASISLW